MSGYCDCQCRDCFDIAICDVDGKPAMCGDCKKAECEPDSECSRDDAYGVDADLYEEFDDSAL